VSTSEVGAGPGLRIPRRFFLRWYREEHIQSLRDGTCPGGWRKGAGTSCRGKSRAAASEKKNRIGGGLRTVVVVRRTATKKKRSKHDLANSGGGICLRSRDTRLTVGSSGRRKSFSGTTAQAATGRKKWNRIEKKGKKGGKL